MGLRRDIKEGDYPPKREISKKTKGVARLLNVKEECNIMSFPNSDAESKGKKKLNNKNDCSEIMSGEECNSTLSN